MRKNVLFGPGIAGLIAVCALLGSTAVGAASGAPKADALTPSSRLEAGVPAVEIADATESLVYLFHAEALGFPESTVVARFEFRTGDRVIGNEELLLRFGDAASLLVPIPGLSWNLGLPDLHLLVFAEGLLLNDFDRSTLLAYNRSLQYTHREEMPPPSQGQGGTGESIDCGSPCGGGCGPWDDYDCDGVNNATDNCTDDSNPQQEDCDGDGLGDVCDGIDGNFQPTGPVKTCMTDKDLHWHYFDFEHHVEQRLVDVSSCGSPDRWNRWIRDTAHCGGLIGDQECCLDGLTTSIQQVGDSPSLWCGSKRNIDFCH